MKQDIPVEWKIHETDRKNDVTISEAIAVFGIASLCFKRRPVRIGCRTAGESEGVQDGKG